MFEDEMETGRNAVVEAMRISKTIQKEMTGIDSITKSDKSPVTVADFTAQAIICRILKDRFPNVPIVAEERSDVLRNPENEEVLKKILHYLSHDSHVGKGVNKDDLFRDIDFGKGEPADIFWALDPIDGTKGFLRGEQFAIALALIVVGEVRLGILGCPNLQLTGHGCREGCLLFAMKGDGAESRETETGRNEKIRVSTIIDPRKMRFVESYVSTHSNMEMQLQIAETLGIAGAPVQMDSQVKYGVVGTGNAEIYLRIPHPKTPDYREKIWDHAAGSLIVEEAGGVVTDILGNRLDFSRGKTLADNRGIFASVPSVHDQVLKIISDLQ
jgi:3'(2'), 5'-bisphosphate nucleotidase